MRPKNRLRMSKIINEELINYIETIDEIFDSELLTNYVVIKKIVMGYDTITYRFKTTSGESYDLEFFDTSVNSNIDLDDGSKLSNIIETNGQQFLSSIDIGFTLTSTAIKYNDEDDIENDDYSANTNKNESIDVMKRISYLIGEFINQHPNINIYVIGRNTHKTKLMIYKNIFKNIFKNNFILTEGKSTNYKEGALYFINKSIIK